MEPHTSAELSEKHFFRFSELITKKLGIKMPEMKRTMLQGRLSRRLRALQLNTFDEYCNYIFSSQGQEKELKHFFDVVTTNKTEFFRESRHFDYLISHALPDLLTLTNDEGRKKINVWSAGCSNGAEPYTLAMVLSDYAEKKSGFDFMILATDISTAVLDTAGKAVYSEDDIAQIPMNFRKKYLLKSKDRDKRLIRMAPLIRAKVKYHRLNFMDEHYRLQDKIDIVFIRNVLIYFDNERQHQVLMRFCRHLRRGGYLFSGHSETLSGLDLPLECEGTTIYRRI